MTSSYCMNLAASFDLIKLKKTFCINSIGFLSFGLFLRVTRLCSQIPQRVRLCASDGSFEGARRGRAGTSSSASRLGRVQSVSCRPLVSRLDDPLLCLSPREGFCSPIDFFQQLQGFTIM